ncbi:UNVERIFIED_ORG: hypothetical protein L601_000200001670 [Gordonia westfalica J30]
MIWVSVGAQAVHPAMTARIAAAYDDAGDGRFDPAPDRVRAAQRHQRTPENGQTNHHRPIAREPEGYLTLIRLTWLTFG